MELDQIVHPNHNHEAHNKCHFEYGEQTGNETEQMVSHMQGHDQMLAQQNNALGNTKELGGGAGNLVQQEAGSIRSRQQGAPTGRFTPSEGRA